MTTVALVDSHTLVRSGLRRLLADEVEVVWDAADGDAGARCYREAPVDVVVTAFMMDGRNGIEMAEEIHRGHPDASVVVLSVCSEPAFVRRLLGVGIRGFVSKSAVPDVLLRAIQRVAGGDVFIDPSVRIEHASMAIDELSKREFQVLMALARGLTNREIANRLRVSVKTIDSHRLRALKKLGLRNNVDVVRFALRAGLVRR